MNNINLVKIKIKCNTFYKFILCKCHKIAKVSHPIIWFHSPYPILILKIVK